jgi:hypothetical protein
VLEINYSIFSKRISSINKNMCRMEIRKEPSLDNKMEQVIALQVPSYSLEVEIMLTV